MADVHLGIDVDTTDVGAADRQLDRFGDRLRGMERGFGGVGRASADTDRRIRGVADATRMAETRTRAAAAQMATMQAQLNGIRGIATAAAGALAGYIGIGVIRNVVSFAQELEKLERTFTTVTGSSESARAEMAYVDETARRLGQSIGTASSAYAKLFAAADASKIPLSDTRAVFEGLAAASTALGIGQQEFEGALLAVQQMMSKGVVSAEELRGQLGERLPVAFGVAADAMGMSMAELSKALETGKITAQAFVGNFGRELLERYEDVAAGSTGITRTINDLQNAMRDLGKAALDAGLLDSLLTFTDILTDIAESDAAAAMLTSIGAALKLVADNGEASAVAIGLLTAALAANPLTRIAGVAVAAAGALSDMADKTREVGGEQVTQGQIIKTIWGDLVREAQAMGDLIGAVWDYIATQAASIPDRLRSVWLNIQVDFFTMVQALAEKWAGFLSRLATDMRDIPDFGAMEGIAAKIEAAAGRAALGAAQVQTTVIEAQGEVDALGAKIRTNVGGAWDKVVSAAEAYSGVVTANGDAIARTAEMTSAAAAESEKLARLTKQRVGLEGDAAAATTKTAAALGKAGGAAKKVADELARAKDVLNDQVLAHDRLLAGLRDAGVASEFVTQETDKLRDALEKSGTSLEDFLKLQGMSREEYTRMLQESEKVTAQIEHQKAAAGELVNAFRGLAFGTMTGAEGIGGIFSALTEGAFGDTLDKAFEDAATTLSDAFSKSMANLSGATGMSAFATASIGTGIGIAATGALQGNAQQIGSGIGSAVGGVAGDIIGAKIGGTLGGIAGPVGMALGAVAGGFIANLFGGGDEDKWKEVAGRAFTGTTYEAAVTSRGRINTQTDQGFSPEGRFAFDGLVKLLGNFNTEIKQFVRATGGQVESGLELVVNQNAALEAIAGRTRDLPYKGEEGKRFAEEISTRVAEVMALAGEIARKSGPALTNAQVAWREVQKRFSEDNVAILRDLGFSAKRIRDAQRDIRRDLARDFNAETLGALVDTGRATQRELAIWKNYEFRALEERRIAAVRTAREIGGSVDLVQSSFRAQKNEIVENYRDMLSDLADATADALGERLSRLTTKLNGLEQDRSEILTELTRRAEEARNAERTLADARRSLAVSDLAPGGPLDQFRALQSQFSTAIGAARGGDAGAASQAGSLAQALLQQGQQVYGSTTAYADLFRAVNTQLSGAQGAFGGAAARIERRLDPETFTTVTEKSTAALLRGLGTINATMERTEAAIDRLERKLASTQQRGRVA